jgi:hypothetical protein
MGKRGKISKPIPSREIDERPIKWRKYPHLFLIVCEDESTEPYYFEKFKDEFGKIYPNETVFLHPVGTGHNSKGVVEQAKIEKKNLFEKSNKTVDEVWAVFDKDDLDQSEGNKQRFVEAFEIAEKENIQIAYSNEVFELWLLLHFTNVTSEEPIPRADIYAKLEECIKKNPSYSTFVYEHGNKNIVDIVLKLGNEPKAIERANRLNSEHSAGNRQPIDANPNTRVNILVKRLRELLDYYSYQP